MNRIVFSAIFFVSAGLLIDPTVLWTYKVPILIVTLATLIGKTTTGAPGSLLAGFPLQTSLKVGMSLAQIGEFSFVFASVALRSHLASLGLLYFQWTFNSMKSCPSKIARKRRQARESLARLRKLVASRPSPFAGLSIEQAIQRMRSVREELWNRKFAARS